MGLWEISTGRKFRSFEGHSGAVKSVCFGPDGRLALTASDTASVDNIRLWEVAAGRCLRTFSTTAQVKCASLSSNGRSAAWGIDSHLYKQDEPIWIWSLGQPGVMLPKNWTGG